MMWSHRASLKENSWGSWFRLMIFAKNSAKGRRIVSRAELDASALGMLTNTANSSARIVSLGFRNAFLRACLLKVRIAQEGIRGFFDLRDHYVSEEGVSCYLTRNTCVTGLNVCFVRTVV